MNDRLETLLQRMPSQFASEPESNNYKLLSIIAESSKENRTMYDTMLKFWDVDTAEGIGLDRLGKDEGISRGGWGDEEYRKMIKIQCILNLSEGDIEVMNQIMEAYMGDDFIGFEDGWADFEPASMLLNIRASATSVPSDLLQRIKPVGVRIYAYFNELKDFILLHAGTYTWSLNYKICGRFKTATTQGTLGKEIISVTDGTYGFSTNPRICGRFRAGGVRN